jgi:hypothetical protein
MRVLEAGEPMAPPTHVARPDTGWDE